MTHDPLALLEPRRSELDELIEEFRRELAAELPTKLHAFSPAGGKHSRGGPAEPSADDEAAEQVAPTEHYYDPGMTGLPFSRQFDRFLSGEHGGDFLATDSFTEIRDFCRVQHWQEEHTGTNPFAWNLCARLVIAAVELQQPITHIADTEKLDVWLAKNLLSTALIHARDWRADRRKGVRMMDESRKQLNESEALPVVLAREHRIEDEQRLWESIRQQTPCDCGGALPPGRPKEERHPYEPHFYLPPWEKELARRRAFHAKRCDEGCVLVSLDKAA